MWYVIQVQTRHEQEIAEECRSKILKPGEEVFVMMGERAFQDGKQWTKKYNVAFPSYVFFDTTKPDELKLRLREIKKMTKLLSVGEDITPMSTEEEEFYKKLGGKEHIIRYSEGYMLGDTLVVETGPMKGLEGKITWIDRHRRYAALEVQFMGQTVSLRLGLGVTDKKQAHI